MRRPTRIGTQGEPPRWMHAGGDPASGNPEWSPPEERFALAALRLRCPLFVTGPPGAGKSRLMSLVLARVSCELCGEARPIVRVPLSAESTADDLFGRTELRGGETRYETGPVTLAMEHRLGLLLDDFDCAPAHVQLLFLSAFAHQPVLVPYSYDDRSGMPLEIDPWAPDPRTGRPSGFAVAATANTNGSSVEPGFRRHAVDAALLDRMTVLEMRYPPLAAEARLLARHCGIPRSQAEDIAQFAALARSAADSGQLSAPVSMRQTLRLAGFVAHGLRLEEAFALAILERYPSEERLGLCEIYQAVWGGTLVDVGILHDDPDQ